MEQRRHVPSTVFDIRRQLRRKIKSHFPAAEEPKQWYARVELGERPRLNVWGPVVERLTASYAGKHEADRIAAVRRDTTRNAEPLQAFLDVFQIADLGMDDDRCHLQTIITAECNTETRRRRVAISVEQSQKQAVASRR